MVTLGSLFIRGSANARCFVSPTPLRRRDTLPLLTLLLVCPSPMSSPLLDVPVALPRPALRPRPEGEAETRAAALQRIQSLSHYRPDYAYRPDRYLYTETHTSDPHYVVFGVRLTMAPSYDHGECLAQMRNALKILGQALDSEVHVSMEVNITRIPGAFFGAEPHTSTLQPDLCVWPGPAPVPARNLLSYRYDRDGAPWLVVEVVSQSERELRDNDWRHKMAVYAQMGIREYWLLDRLLPDPLHGFTLDAAAGAGAARYRPIATDADGGMDSRALQVSLRWAEGGLQCWQEGADAWVRVTDIPVMQAELKARAEGEIEGELKMWGRMLHRILDAAVPGAADQVLQVWAETPPSAWPSDETLDRLESDPGQWRRLLLAESAPADRIS